MDVITRERLRELTGVESSPVVSIFLPTHRQGPDSRRFAPEDLIRWKNLLREAEHRLRETGMSARDAESLLTPARGLSEDPFFWQYQADGLAAFAAPHLFRTFRISIPLEELVVVAPRFHLTPVLPLLVGNGHFLVLALSQNEVRLVEATRDSAEELDLPGVPGSLKQALRYDDPEKQLQYRSIGPRGRQQGALFHGHGAGTDDRGTNTLRFCQQVDRSLAPMLRHDGAPLVLCAVESLAAIYREANTYPHLIDAVVAGNPEGESPALLRDRAWPHVEPILHRAREAAVERFHAVRGTAEATEDLAETLGAAADGRLDVLFVPTGIQQWGSFDDRTRRVHVHDSPQPGDEELYNLAAIRSVRAGGTVYAVQPDEVAAGDRLAALLRY